MHKHTYLSLNVKRSLINEVHNKFYAFVLTTLLGACANKPTVSPMSTIDKLTHNQDYISDQEYATKLYYARPG